MCGSMVDIQTATAEIRRGKKDRKKKKKPQGKNIMSSSATQGGHNNCETALRFWPNISVLSLEKEVVMQRYNSVSTQNQHFPSGGTLGIQGKIGTRD